MSQGTATKLKPFLVTKANESKTGGKRSREAIWTGEE